MIRAYMVQGWNSIVGREIADQEQFHDQEEVLGAVEKRWIPGWENKFFCDRKTIEQVFGPQPLVRRKR